MPGIEHRVFHAARAGVVAALALWLVSAATAGAVDLPKDGVEFFENKIRPVLADRCYNCHDGSGVKAVKGEFTLDTRKGLLAGGESGKAAIVPGDPAASPLIRAIKWQNAKFRMPPKEEHKLSAEQVADFEAWVKMGAPDPRERAGGAGAAKQGAPPDPKRHWAFQA